MALGTFAVVNGSVSATAVGPGANVLNSEGGFSGGRNSKVENSKDGTALGVGATISGAANATLADSVALGADAITSAATPTNSASVNGINYSGFAGVNNDTNYVVSVGKNGGERQVQNVAAGRITENSTDAINGSQLYHVLATGSWTIGDQTDHSGNGVNNVRFGDRVDFIGSGATTVNVSKTADNKTLVNISSPVYTAGNNINLTTNSDGSITISSLDSNTLSNLTSYLPDTSKVANPNGSDVNKQDAPTTLTDDNRKEAATVQDVLNTGWNLQGNGVEKDFVAAYDTVNFANGLATDVVDNKDGKLSNITFNVKYDNSTIVLDENGNLKANLSNIINGDNTTTEANNGTVSVKTGDVTANTTTGKAESNTANGTIAKVEDVANAINHSGWKTNAKDANGNDVTDVLVNPGDTVNYVDGNGTKANVTVTKGENGNPDTFNVTYDVNTTNAVANTTTGKAELPDATKGGDTLNATTITNLVNNVFHTVNSTNKDEQIEAANGTTMVKAGDTLDFVAGKNLVVNQTGKTIAFGLSRDIDVGNITAGNVTVGNTTVTNGTISGLNPNLPNTNNNDEYKVGDEITKSQTLPSNLNITNAATVGDILNSGWNLQNNGQARDFVKPYDSVNFVNGTATTAVVETEANGTVSNVTYNVNVDDSTIKVVDGKLVANATNIVNQVTGNSTVTDGKANATTVDQAGNQVDNSNKIATVGDIVNTINNVHWNATAGNVTGTNGEFSSTGSEPIKAGDTVVYNAGKNIKIEQNGKTFNISTTDNVTFTHTNTTTLTVGNVSDPNHSTNITSGPKGLNVNGDKITGVANGSQLYSVGDSIKNIFGGNTTFNTTTGKVEGFERVLNTTGLAPSENYTIPAASATNITEAFEQLNNYVNAGWKLGNASGAVVERISPDEQVNFVDSNTITSTVVANDKGGANISFNVNATAVANNATGNVSANSTTGKAEFDNHNNTKPLATVEDVAKTVNNTGWFMNTTAGEKALVNPGDTVNYVDGNGTKAKVTVTKGENGQPDTFNVTYDIKSADNTIAVTPKGVKVNTTTGAVNDNGTVKVTQPDLLLNASEVANLVNNASFKATIGRDDTDFVDQVGKDNYKVKAGDTITFNAGKNLRVKQENGTFTYALDNNITVNHANATALTVGNVSNPTAPKVDFNAEEAKPATNNQEAPKNALNITTDGKPTQITGVGSTLNTTNVVTNPDGNASTPVENKTLVDLTNATTPDSAATVRDLQNMGGLLKQAVTVTLIR
ncbi:hypothetical protein BKK55_01250 [Rodentibacter genomosp. 2]|uniref:Trimeric autotransporter adhesin YadA-like stalk domain-containing protein n=1 Tax=Rodentibacter genomosp. 2 TaxID=1908266 RepID=A0A1V3JR26_9PAST|nr:hypothetical protein BKK55_01250 [Rodentibacter genomosp. 2]